MAKQHVILTDEEERVGKLVVDAAFHVHKNLGPGLLEKVYRACMCHELAKRGLSFEDEHPIKIAYDGIKLDAGLRLDIVVEDLIVCELKAVKTMIPLFDAQLLSYLKLSGIRFGFLINFHVPLFKDGIKRMVYEDRR